MFNIPTTAKVIWSQGNSRFSKSCVCFFYKIVFILANKVDHDKMQHSIASDQSLHYLPKYQFMLCSPCCAIGLNHYECFNWPFLSGCGISLKFQAWIQSDWSQYILIRFSGLGCHIITIGQFQEIQSATI